MACEHSCCPRSPKARELGHPDSCVGRWATCLPEGLEPSFEILKLRKNIESDVLTLGFRIYLLVRFETRVCEVSPFLRKLIAG